MLTSVSQRNVVAARPARSTVVVRAQAKPEAPKENVNSSLAKMASHAVASAVSAALLVSSVAPSAVQAAVPIQNQGESIEVAFNFGQDGPTTEAARIGPVETAQRAADKLNDATGNVFGNVPQKSGANYGSSGSAPSPQTNVTGSGPVEALSRGANEVKSAVQGAASDAKSKVAFNFFGSKNPADAAKDAADKAAGGAQELANKTGSIPQKVENAAKTPVSQRPNFQDAQDKLFPNSGNNSTPGKPATSKFAQLGAGNGELVAFNLNPIEAAKDAAKDAIGNEAASLGDKALSIGKGIQNQASNNAEGLQNRAENISQGAQNKSSSAASDVKGAFNSASNGDLKGAFNTVANNSDIKGAFDNVANNKDVKGAINNVASGDVKGAINKASSAASEAKGLFGNVANKAQDKAEDASSSAKGLFSNVANKVQGNADDASSKAQGVFSNVKNAATTPVSQRPTLQDAQDKLFPTTGNTSTPGKPQVTKDVFGRDIANMERTSNTGQAIQREVRDAAGAAGRAANSVNIPTPNAPNVNLPDVGSAIKGLTNKAQNAASNLTNNI